MYGQNNGYFMNGYNQQGYNPYMSNGAMPDMLNQAKMQYAQPMAQQTMQTQPMQTQNPMQKQSNDMMIFVLNENEASAYPVAPNNCVVLWDKDKKTFYIKTANAQGIPSMQIYDFAERTETHEKRTETHKCTCGDKFATKEQLKALEGKINDISAMCDELKERQTVKATKKAKESEK